MKKISIIELLLMFGIPGSLMYLSTDVVIPLLDSHRIFPIEISWFLSGGLLVLFPMLIASLVFVRKEIPSFTLETVCARLRIKSLKPLDWAYAIGSLILVTGLTTLFVRLGTFIPGFNATPAFMDNLPLEAGNYWILLAWLPFFFLNIFGEELLWRGYIQPRQELLTKGYTWLVHGVLWSLFHVGLGWSAIFLALPYFFVLPLVVKIRKNTTIGIITHAIFGTFGFLSLAFGFVG
jgi:membrane protease YdiL (CAAX protease family)